MSHWAERYLWADLRWSECGCGPREWNCWNFSREIQRIHYGRDLPSLELGDAQAVRHALSDSRALRAWGRRTCPPKDGDMVLMQGLDLHVGVWLSIDFGGGVLHCARGLDVVFSDIDMLSSLHGFRIKRVYGYE